MSISRSPAAGLLPTSPRGACLLCTSKLPPFAFTSSSVRDRYGIHWGMAALRALYSALTLSRASCRQTKCRPSRCLFAHAAGRRSCLPREENLRGLSVVQRASGRPGDALACLCSRRARGMRGKAGRGSWRTCPTRMVVQSGSRPVSRWQPCLRASFGPCGCVLSSHAQGATAHDTPQLDTTRACRVSCILAVAERG